MLDFLCPEISLEKTQCLKSTVVISRWETFGLFSYNMIKAQLYSSVHLMMTSSNGNIFRVTGYKRNSPVIGALRFSFICARTNCWVNNRDPGDLRRHRARYDITVMSWNNVVWQVFVNHCAKIAFLNILCFDNGHFVIFQQLWPADAICRH